LILMNNENLFKDKQEGPPSLFNTEL